MSLLRWLFDLPPDAFAGVDEWSLRLVGVPRNVWAIFGLAALFGLLGWVVVRSYGREGKMHRPVKMGLMVLRLAVLGILLVVLLQPAVVMRYRKVFPSVVVVLVDDSLSMQWKDADAGGQTRTQRVQAVLGRQGGALARLAAEHPLMLFRFAARGDGPYTEPLSPAANGQTSLAKLEAGGYETNLGRAVRECLNQLEGRAIEALVVVSDGQNTTAGNGPESSGPPRLAAALDLLHQRNIPAYAVAVGDPSPPRNIMLAQLQGPGEVRKGSTSAFTALVTHRGFGGAEATVELLRARVGTDQWEKTGVAETFALAGGDEQENARLQEVPLRVEATEVGEFIYRAVIEPRSGEMMQKDNEARARLRVSDEKVSVLLVSGDAGWEFQYLRNYLLKHPEHYKVSVWQQNAEATFNQEASTGMKRSTLPMTRDELFAYDVVLLYDPRYVAGSLDSPLLGLLEEFVGSHHGGLCYVVGQKFTDANLLPGGPFDALAKLLPVVLGRPGGTVASRLAAVRTAYPIELTPAGSDHPLMQLAGGPRGPEANVKAWKALPGAFRTHPVSRLKTAASALAVSGDTSRQTGDGQREPVVAIQYYGKGRVLYLGFDSTWRWRFVEDTKHYQKFWANAVDFLSAGRLQKKRILITAGGDVFDAGSQIRVRVEAYNRDFTPMGGDKFTVRLTAPGGEEGADFTLASVREGFFEGLIPAGRLGHFEIRAKANAAGQADWLEDDVSPKPIEIRLPEEEFRRPEANFATLRQLAVAEERFLLLADSDRLVDLIRPPNRVNVTEVPHTIWNTMAVLLLVGTLLLIEWTIRKVFHMV